MILVAAAIFLGVTCLVGGLLLFSAGSRSNLAEARFARLQVSGPVSNDAVQHDYVRSLIKSLRTEHAGFGGLEQFLSRLIDLRQFIEQAGLSISPVNLMLACGGGVLAGATLGMVSPVPLLTAPLMGVLGGVAPLTWVWFKRKRRLAAFERQFPEALELLGRSLRAGHSLVDGIRLAAEEMSEPIAGEFARCHEQQQLGRVLEDVLREMAKRVPLIDFHYFVTAIVLQRQTGGDAAEILDKIGRLIRERFQIRGQIRALTGEGRLSGVVLVVLPFLLAIYMYFRNPAYLRPLFQDPLGQQMACGAIVSMLFGSLVIKKIVDIRV